MIYLRCFLLVSDCLVALRYCTVQPLSTLLLGAFHQHTVFVMITITITNTLKYQFSSLI